MSSIYYTYVVGWTKLNKFYYGVRFAKNCHPNDFWKNYFTSSKLVKNYRETYGEPDHIQIRKTFNDIDSAIHWEQKVLKRLNVLQSDKWLNQNIGGAVKLNEDTYKIISKKLKQYKQPEEKKQRISSSMKKYMATLTLNERQGKSSVGGKALWKKFKDNPTFAEELREKRRNQINPMQGKKQKRICCLFCKKETSYNNLHRHKDCK
jgi:hypothetical protein